MRAGFVTPPEHVSLKAKKAIRRRRSPAEPSPTLLQGAGDLSVSIPMTTAHVHSGEGRSPDPLGEQTVILRKDKSFLVRGEILHSVWNNSDGETVMIGISVV